MHMQYIDWPDHGELKLLFVTLYKYICWLGVCGPSPVMIRILLQCCFGWLIFPGVQDYRVTVLFAKIMISGCKLHL